MGQELFGVDIAGLIADNIGPGLLDVTITRYTPGAREAGNLTGGRAKAPATVTGIKGIWEDLPSMPPAGVEFELNDRIALLIGDTIPAGGLPLRNDAIEIEGLTLYMVQLMKRDPAAATYRYLCRDRRGPDGV
ncbi:hypothetical protein vBEliSR6L_96 [Erythrobacter phage vB_EliS_R6L]|nr:hypothetical protein vBEliSR6L_96 [Erythrobacter phage vB_EliS_R6L]